MSDLKSVLMVTKDGEKVTFEIPVFGNNMSELGSIRFCFDPDDDETFDISLEIEKGGRVLAVTELSAIDVYMLSSALNLLSEIVEDKDRDGF